MSPARRALLATVSLRIACSAFAWRFAQLVPINPVLETKNNPGFDLQIAVPGDGWRYLLFGIWDRFDSLWYLNIAIHGYDRPATIVFYPLYPLLIRCFNLITGEPTLAALIISTVATFFLFWGIQELVSLDRADQAFPAIATIAAWPAAFVFFAAYPESLLIALVIWSIYFARTDRWWAAGFLACAAGFTKAAGVMVIFPLCVILFQQRRWNKLPAIALSPLGFIGYSLWLKMSGFPPSIVVYSTYWATRLSLPWTTLLHAFLATFRDADWLVAINLAALLYTLLVLILKKRGRLDYLLFSIACLLLFLTKHTEPVLQSTPRYVLLVFPVFLYTAGWIKSRAALWLMLLLFCPLYFALFRTFLWWGLVV